MNAVSAPSACQAGAWPEDQGSHAASLRDSFPTCSGDRAKEAGASFCSFAARQLAELRRDAGAGDLPAPAAASALSLHSQQQARPSFFVARLSIWAGPGISPGLVGAADRVEDKPPLAPVDLALAGVERKGPRCRFVGGAWPTSHQLRVTWLLSRAAGQEPPGPGGSICISPDCTCRLCCLGRPHGRNRGFASADSVIASGAPSGARFFCRPGPKNKANKGREP